MSLQFNTVALLLVVLILLGVLSNNSSVTISAAILLLMQQTFFSQIYSFYGKARHHIGYYYFDDWRAKSDCVR